MPYTKESDLMGKDAPNSTATELCFNPPNGPFGEDNQVTGNIDRAGDEDWIIIELSEGKKYTITVGGDDDNNAGTKELNDSVLKLMDGKGGVIMMNDDVDPAKGKLSSKIEFTPEAGSGTQKYYISVSGYTGNPGADNTGTYTVNVAEMAVLPVGAGADIEGTDVADKLAGTDASESIAGLDGDDTLDGMGGDDTLDGGAGHDLLIGGKGADKLIGGDAPGSTPGIDTISYEGSAEGVTINLRAGTASGGDAEGDILGSDIEYVRGSMYDDMLSGDRGDNMLWGLGGSDNLFGDKGEDDLFGGMGDDTLDGGDGEDTLEGGYGADVLTGGEDDDTASYMYSMMGVTVRLHSGQAMGGDAEGDSWGDMVTLTYMLPDEDGEMQEHTETVPDIVNLTGSGNADILAGDSRANTIKGGGGDDSIYGGPGGGDDMLHGGGGADRVFGGYGEDTLYGEGGDDMLHGGPGDDTYYGGYGSDMIYAGNEDSIINGWVEAPPDNNGNTEKDESMESVSDSRAVDTVSYERLKVGVNKILSVDGITNIENITGTDENDSLTGDGGNNVIDGRDGADVLSGGTNTTGDLGDTVSYMYSDRGVNITVDSDGNGSASGGHAQGDTITNFENATGSAHDDNLNGDEGANTLKGLGGDDELIGGTGADIIEGGAGADEMDGGTSSASAGAANLNTYNEDGTVNVSGDHGADTDGDTLSYAGSDAAVTVNLATITVSGGHAEGDEIEVQRDAYDPDGQGNGDPIDVATFEHITGSMHNDRLTGDHRMNTIMGGDGDDTIRGGGDFDNLMGQKGDDNISGGAGGDHLVGGPGADRLDGGEMRGERDNMIDNPDFDEDDPEGPGNMRKIPTTDIDWAVYRPAEAGVTVDLSASRGTGGDAMGDRLIGIEVVWGSKHDDIFIASADEDTYDIIHGDSGSDTVSYEASEVGVMVDLGDHNDNASVTVSGDAAMGFTFTYAPDEDTPSVDHTDEGVDSGDAATNGAFGDRLGGISNLTGSNHKDTLDGDDNPNVLKGGGGNDMLNGEGNVDKLYGGDGRDTLVGGGGADTLNGGAGNDELTGDGDGDTFVFTPGDGDDVINDLNISEGDRIDLRAFDVDADELAGLLSVWGVGDNARVIVSVGDITIELAGIEDIDDLDSVSPAVQNDTLDLTKDAEGNIIDTGVFII